MTFNDDGTFNDEGGASQKAVQTQLERILADAAFTRAPRMSRLLQFLVAEELRGNGARLKGYTVGVDALGKPLDFDPSHDAGVRVETGRLRRMLSDYFRDNPAAAVSITIPKGSYRPRFEALHPVVPSAPRGTPSPMAGPTIALVPFEAAGAEAGIAQRLTREVRLELFRYREYQLVDVERPDEIRNLAEYCRDALRAEFMLTGQVGEQSASVSATDLETGAVIWVAEVPADTASSAGLSSAAREIVQPLTKPSGVIPVAAIQKRYNNPPESWDASECVLRWHFYRLRERTRETHAALRQQIRRQLAAHPWFELGYVMYSMLTLDEVVYGLNPDTDEATTLRRARYLIEQAMGADGGQFALAHYVKAQTHYFSGNRAGFQASIERALALHPHNPDLQHHAGVFLCYAGSYARGRELVELANQLHNSSMGYRLGYLLLDYLGVFDIGALELFESSYVPPGLPVAHLVGALLYARAGRRADAVESLRQATAESAIVGQDINRMVELWLLDPEARATVATALDELRVSSNVIPFTR